MKKENMPFSQLEIDDTTPQMVENAKEILELKALKDANGWVKCSERLPEDGLIYLVAVEKTKEEKELNFGNPRQDDIGIARFEDGEWQGGSITIYAPTFARTVLKGITHWCEIPNLPKE